MKKVLILTAVLPLIAACTPPNTLVCDREAIAWDKWGDPTEIAENCLPAPIRAAVPIVVTGSDDPHDPMLPPTTPPKVPPTTPPSEPPTEPPSEPRVKGNNGWGNGDQSAPGRSINRNRAENNGVGRTQRVHGKPNQN